MPDSEWCFRNLKVWKKKQGQVITPFLAKPGKSFEKTFSIQFKAPSVFGDSTNEPTSTLVYCTFLEYIKESINNFEFIQAAADVEQSLEKFGILSPLPDPLVCFSNGSIHSHMANQITSELSEAAFAKCRHYLIFRYVTCPLLIHAVLSFVQYMLNTKPVVYQHFSLDSAELLSHSWRPDPREYPRIDPQYSVCASYVRSLLKFYFCPFYQTLSPIEVVFLYRQLFMVHIFPIISVYDFSTVTTIGSLDKVLPSSSEMSFQDAVDLFQQMHTCISKYFSIKKAAILICPTRFITKLSLVPTSSSIGTKGWGYNRSFAIFEHFNSLQRQGKEFGLTHELLHHHKLAYPTPLHNLIQEGQKRKRGDPSSRPVARINPTEERAKRWFLKQWKMHMTQDKTEGTERLGVDEFVCLIYYFLNCAQPDDTGLKLDSLSHEIKQICNTLRKVYPKQKGWFYLKIESKLHVLLGGMRAAVEKAEVGKSHSTSYNKWHQFASTCLDQIKQVT